MCAQSILGLPSLQAEQMEAYCHTVNPAAPYYADLYLSLGAALGVRGDLAYCCHRGYLSSNCLTPMAPVTCPTMMSPPHKTSPARATARPGTFRYKLTSRRRAAPARRTPAVPA